MFNSAQCVVFTELVKRQYELTGINPLNIEARILSGGITE